MNKRKTIFKNIIFGICGISIIFSILIDVTFSVPIAKVGVELGAIIMCITLALSLTDIKNDKK